MKFIRIAAILGAVAVILGAFGAHALKAVLQPEQLQTFETGVRYQFYHSLALLLCGILAEKNPSARFRMAASSFIVGMVLFSGSLYMLSMRTILGMENLTWLGPVTPIGGLMFILGWAFLYIGATEKNK